MFEFTFVEPKTGEEAYVRLSENGTIIDVYADRHNGIFCVDHEDADRLRGFTWREGKNPLFLHSKQPEGFVAYLWDKWVLSRKDMESWDKVRSQG